MFLLKNVFRLLFNQRVFFVTNLENVYHDLYTVQKKYTILFYDVVIRKSILFTK